jgi:hypothetical protein
MLLGLELLAPPLPEAQGGGDARLLAWPSSRQMGFSQRFCHPGPFGLKATWEFGQLGAPHAANIGGSIPRYPRDEPGEAVHRLL